MTRSRKPKEKEDKDHPTQRVTRSHKGKSASVDAAGKGSEDGSAHAGYSGSRAWLALGEQMLDEGDYNGAIECAQKGLDELGDDYAGPEVDDDTDLKLAAARERIAQGHAADGAKVMLRTLKTRTNLYSDSHAEEIGD